MTQPTPKILLALLTLATITGAASAQQRIYTTVPGKVVGRSSTDSSGTVTNYDASGKVISSRESTSGNQTTIYDAGGKFSREYRRLFVEKPSQTLARAHHAVSASLLWISSTLFSVFNDGFDLCP